MKYVMLTTRLKGECFHMVVEADDAYPIYHIALKSRHRKNFAAEWRRGKCHDQGDEYMIFCQVHGENRNSPVTDPELRKQIIATAWPMVME